ncbi:cytochrome P450 [Infundibulicybe gibba]|nr:cytochrome P450 [Infundibulicybe gibba]
MKEDSFPLIIVLASVGYLFLNGEHRKVGRTTSTQENNLTSLQLAHIPTIGSPYPILSLIGTFRFIFNARGMLQKGYDQHKPIFKVPRLNHWVVVLADQKMIDEFRRAPDDAPYYNVLSFQDAVNELLQIDHTLGPRIYTNPYHVNIIRSRMAGNVNTLMGGLHEEVMSAFQAGIPTHSRDWVKLRVGELVTSIVCRASNRIFVGFPLCQDPGYVDLNTKFTLEVAWTGILLNLTPKYCSREAATRLVRHVPRSIARATRYLAPTIDARREELRVHGKSYPGKPNDFLSWLIDEANEEESSHTNLALRILTVNFAAIHTTSLTLTQVLYDLATRPKYMEPLRKEIDEVVAHSGWSKDSLDKMHLVDSFIRETLRLNGLGCFAMVRRTRKDFTFSNGIVIPAGTQITADAYSLQRDSANYADPDDFDGFRFAKLADGKKHNIVSTESTFLAFGHGKHACPGRFFAAVELKMMLAYLVMNYDVKTEAGWRPRNIWIAEMCTPDPAGELMFRKRT